MTSASRTAVAIWLALLVLSGIAISRINVTTDLTALLPRAADRVQSLLVAQLRDGVAARLILIGLEGAEPEALAEASRAIARRLVSNGLFSYVNNGDPAQFAAEREVLMSHRYLLSPAVTPDRFTAKALHASLSDQLRLLGSPAGAVTKSLLPADPTGELAQVLSEVLPHNAPPMFHGVWFSRDGKRAQLVAESRAPGFDLDGQGEAVAAIRQAFREAELPITARLLLSGPAVFAVEARATIEHESWRLSLIAGVLVFALLVMVYRSAPLIFLSLLPVLTGLLISIATVQWLFGFVHGITLGFGATLIGEAVDYPAYLFTNLAPGERPYDTLLRIWPTLRLAVLTTVFGGLSMLLSSFTGLSQLGVLIVVGVLAAGLVTRWVVPALAPRPRTEPSSHFRHVDWSRPWRWIGRGRHIVWLAVAAAVAFLAVSETRIWDDDLANLSPVSQSAKALDQQLRTELGAPDVRFLLVMSAESRDEALALSESAGMILHKLVEEGRLGGFELPSLYVPSRETQERRRTALPEPGILKAALQEALKGLPFREGLFEPFLQDVERARTGELLDPSDFESSALLLKLRALLLHSGNEWTVLADRIAEQGRKFAFLDLKQEADQLVRRYRQEALRLTVFGVASIMVVLWWGLRHVSIVGMVLLPPVLAILFVVTSLLLIGERLSLFHLVSLLLVMGIGLNYSLFFRRAVADEAERRRTALALMVCIGATLAAFGTLAFSRTPVLHAIGLTVSLGSLHSVILSARVAKPAVAR